MRSKQTRRSLSISGPVYARLQAHCEAIGVPISRFAQKSIEEALLRKALDNKPVEKSGNVLTF